VTQPGIPNEFALSTACYGARLATMEAQAFAAVAMGFRRLELGLAESPVPLSGFEESRRETGIEVGSLVTGCLNPLSEHMAGTKLGSLDSELRERAVLSCRRHIQLATRLGCPTVILRGCQIENDGLVAEGEALAVRLAEEGPEEPLVEELNAFVARVQKKGQSQLDHFCRSIHKLRNEFPEMRLAVEPGRSFIDLLNFEAMEWVLDDQQALSYWHDTGTVHLRERAGLPGQADWLDRYRERLVGVHLQDAADGVAYMPPGLGEVDFALVVDAMPGEVEKVVEVDPRHGRSEVLASVKFLIDRGL